MKFRHLLLVFVANIVFSQPPACKAQEVVRAGAISLYLQPLASFPYACKYDSNAQLTLVGKLSAAKLEPGVQWTQINVGRRLKRLREKIRAASSAAAKERLRLRRTRLRNVNIECAKFVPSLNPVPTLTPAPADQTPTPNIGPNSPLEPSDYDLLMLRLVNRARLDPAGEAARIGSSTLDTRAPVPPLAYAMLPALAARNHNTWMHANFGSIPSGRTPDSFSHFESLNGLSTGPAASGTSFFTGVSPGQRLNFVDYSWSNYGENIQTNYATFPLAINVQTINQFHLGWWNSEGHRNNMLYAGFSSFGFFAEVRSFVAPLGGLPAPFNNILFATQTFATSLSQPRSLISGLLYKDRDANSAWTPRASADILREGIGHAKVDVFLANSLIPVVSGETFSNGAFSLPISSGTYDLLFSSSEIAAGSLKQSGIVVGSTNRDIGDIRIP